MIMQHMRWILFIIFIFQVGACAKSQVGLKGVSYSKSALLNYQRGIKALAKKRHQEAIRLFNFVRRRFAYSRYAPQAEVRIADCYFNQERFLEAIDAYKIFMRFRRTNKEVPYAQYRIAHAYFKLIPGDWWLLPPAYEKDQSATYDALREVRKFIRNFPRNEYVVEIRILYRKTLRKLADHEIYVARYYYSRDKYRAALGRLKSLKKKFLGIGLDEEILFSLGKCYLKLNKNKEAGKEFTAVTHQFPYGKYAKKAKEILTRLKTAMQSKRGKS